MARIIGIAGPFKGREYELGEVSIIGRSLDSDIRIPDLTVSRHHARIRKTDKGFVIEDLNSGNGTWVNDKLIKKPTLLRDRDKIAISNAVFRFSTGYPLQQDITDSVPTTRIITRDRPETTIIKALPAQGHSIVETKLPGASTTQIKSRLKTVLEISNSMQSILDLQELLPRIVQALLTLFPAAENCVIMLKNDAGKLIPRAARTRSGRAPGNIVVSRTIVNEVTRNKMSILSADAMSDKRFEKSRSVASMQVRSVMCVPLIFRNDLLGIIYIDTGRPSDRFRFTMEDLDLLTGIASQAALAIQNARMHERLLQRERLERDMQFAHEVQRSFLPDKVPRIEGYEFSAWYGSAQEVGGDFYDFIELPDERVAVVIGDVSGKGVPAALLMARLTSELRFLALSEPEPPSILSRLNERMVSGRTEDRFVTLLYVVLDTKERSIEVANAGHPYPLVRKREEGRLERLCEPINPPLGVMPSVEFKSLRYNLAEGDTVAVFTDGVTEAMNVRKERFGMQRLERAIANGAPGARAIMERILKQVSEFVGLASPSDDLTLVCFGTK